MKLMRASGLPVELENLNAYQTEWTAEFDRLKDKHKTDMLSLQSDLAALENELLAKYKCIIDIDFIKSQKGLKKLMDTYQCPIMVAVSAADAKELVYVLMDRDLGF